MKIKAYQFGYPGSWLGGKIVVAAKTERTARKLARERVSCRDEDLELEQVFHLDQPKVLYDDAGEY